MRAIQSLLITCVACWALEARAQPSLAVMSPKAAPALTETDLVPVQVSMSSSNPIASLDVTFNGQQRSLPNGGVIDATGVPAGLYPLTVTAHDTTGLTESATITIHLDRPPVLRIIRPVGGEVTNGTLSLIVDCLDDDPQGCPVQATIVARCPPRCGTKSLVPPKVLTGQGAHLEWSVDVVPFVEDQQRGLFTDVDVLTTDSAGHTASDGRGFRIDRSQRLIPVVSPGWIADFDDHRVLFNAESGASILDLDTGAVRQVSTGYLTNGALLRDGAFIRVYRPDVGTTTSSVLSDAGVITLDPFSWVYTSGDLVAVLSYGLYDAASGTWVMEQPIARAAFSPRGDLAYATPSSSPGLVDIFLRRASEPTATLIAQQQSVWGAGIRTDGEAVAWYTLGEEFVLGQLDGGQARTFGQPAAFELESGWLIYPASDGTGMCGAQPCMQIFSRAPDGVVTQRTFIPGIVRLQAVGPGRELAVFNGIDYVVPSDGGAPVPFAELGTGTAKYLDGGWWLSNESTLFRVDLQAPVFLPPYDAGTGDQPPPTSPCGCSAGGPAAAGILAVARRRRRRPPMGRARGAPPALRGARSAPASAPVR